MDKPTLPVRELLLKLGCPLSEAVWTDLSQIWEPVCVRRKTILTHAGEKEPYLYFVTEGIQRVYYEDDENREATLVLTYPHSFAGVLDAFLLQTRSAYYFETLSQSNLLRCGHHQFDSVCRKHPELYNFFMRLSHYALSGLLERMAELQCFSAEDKFRKLLSRSPHILQLVPHKYLANYLGIDPSHFSRLVNSVRI